MTQPCQYTEVILENKILVKQLVDSVGGLHEKVDTVVEKVNALSERQTVVENKQPGGTFLAGVAASFMMIGATLAYFAKPLGKALIAFLGIVLK